jgi:hypothetical protein
MRPFLAVCQSGKPQMLDSMYPIAFLWFKDGPNKPVDDQSLLDPLRNPPGFFSYSYTNFLDGRQNIAICKLKYY